MLQIRQLLHISQNIQTVFCLIFCSKNFKYLKQKAKLIVLLNHYRVALDLELVACLVLAKVGKVDPGKTFLLELLSRILESLIKVGCPSRFKSFLSDF